MPILQNNQYLSAVWGARQQFITGLDPLGLQNTSEAAYTQLLMGVTNLTNRIRYYGFYCWLFEQYAHDQRHTDPQHQYRYIRRGELMLALLMQSKHPGYTQVTGSNFASRMVQEAVALQYDLAANADQAPGRATYWKFSSGAFGQYYAGAMREMGLVIRNDHDNFICTQAAHQTGISGVQLAEAFEQSLPVGAGEQFLLNVEQGTLPLEQIEELFQAFGLHLIPTGSTEEQLYQSLLLGVDRPALLRYALDEVTYRRRDTVGYLLRQLSVTSEEDPYHYSYLPWTAYRDKGTEEGEIMPYLQFWYFYYLNELWQFAAGTIFWSLLHQLEQEVRAVPVVEFVNNLATDLSTQLLEDLGHPDLKTITHTLAYCAGPVPDLVNDINTAIRNGQAIIAGSYGLALLLHIYEDNKPQFETLRQLGGQHQLLRDGNMLDAFDFIARHETADLDQFLRSFIAQQIIHRHLFVAFRKTGNGSQSTQKIILEEGLIRHVQTFGPRFTSPRLGAVYHILQDLQWVNEAGELTPEGLALLKQEELW